MSKRPVTTIMLPIERAYQLKALADADGLGVTELIEKIIEDGIERGAIPDETPDFNITPMTGSEEPRWIFDSAGFWLPRLDSEGVRMLADAFEAVADGASKGRSIRIETDELRMARVGKGVVLLGYDLGVLRQKRSITTGMARDLARQLRKAADEAEATRPAMEAQPVRPH